MNSINLKKMNWVTASVLVTLALTSTSLHAANKNWKSTAGSGTWSLAENWNEAAAPADTDTLIFGASTVTALTNDTTADRKYSLTFSAGAPSFIISGNRFNLGTVSNNSGVEQTLDLELLMDGNQRPLFQGNANIWVDSLTSTTAHSSSDNKKHINNLMTSGTLFIGAVNSAGYNFGIGASREKGTLNTTTSTESVTVFGNISAADFYNYSGGTVILSGSGNAQFSYHTHTVLAYSGTDDYKFNATKSLTVYSGNLTLSGGGAKETITNLTLGSGNSSFGYGNTTISRTSGSSTLWLTGNVARNMGSTLTVNGDNILGTSSSTAFSSGFTQSYMDYTGVLPAYVTISGTDWATRDAVTGYLTALPSGSYTPFSTWSVSAQRYHVGYLSGSGTLTAGKQIYTLKIDADGAGQNLNLGAAGNTLGLFGGGLMFNGDYDYTISGGSIGIDNHSNGSLYIWTNGSGALDLQSNITGSGIKTLVKAGAGTLILSGSNLLSTSTERIITIQAGTLKLGGDYAIPVDSRLYLGEGVFDLNGHSAQFQRVMGTTDGLFTITNSDPSQLATLTVGKQDITANGDNQYTGLGAQLLLSGNLRVLLQGNTDTGINFQTANNHTGGFAFRGNTAAVNASPAYFTFTNVAAFGSGPVELLDFGGFTISDNWNNFDKTIIVSGTHTYIYASTKQDTFTGAITGGGDVDFKHNVAGNNTGNWYFSVKSDFSAFTGTVKFSSDGGSVNTVYTNAARHLLSGNALTTGGDATFSLWRPNDYAKEGSKLNTSLQFSGTGSAYNVVLGDLTSGNGFNANATMNGGAAADNASYGVVSNNLANSTATLVIGSANHGYSEFGERIMDSGYLNDAGVITGSAAAAKVAVTKVGTGTWALSGSNSYSGATTVSGGVLLLSGSGQINSTSGITVNSGGVLQYDSSVALTKNVNVSAGGVLGGSGTINTLNLDFADVTASVTGGGLGSTGTLTFSGDQFWQDFTYQFDILSASDHDLLNFTGSLDLSLGDSFTLTVNNLGSLTNFSDVLIISGLASGFDESKWQLGAGYELDYRGTDLFLSYIAPVPEPSTWLLLSLGLALTVILRWRRGAVDAVKNKC